MLTSELDGVRNLDLALVDCTDTGGLHCSSNVLGLDRTKETTILTSLDSKLDLGAFDLGLESLCLFEGCEFASGASSTNLLNLLLAATGPYNCEALRNEVVTGKTVLYLDNVACRTNAGDFIRKNQLRHVRTP